MKCPNCQETLLMTHRNNVEIDYCPNCRGVWLDRGELDKILELSAARPENKGSEAGPYQGKHQESYPYKRKKKSFLDDFFDF